MGLGLGEMGQNRSNGNHVAVLEQKIGCSSAVQKYGPESCTKHFFRVTTCHKRLAQ